MSAERFEEWVREAILSLPRDLKAVLRIVEDPDLSDEGRIAAAGALLHVLSSSNAIPGMRGLLAYVDDVIVLRLVLERLNQSDPEAMATHRKDSPELLEPLDEQLASARDYLGDLMQVLDKAADGVKKLQHHGKNAVQCVRDPDDGNWLYDAVHEAIVEQLVFDEDEVAREIKRIEEIRPPLQARVATQR